MIFETEKTTLKQWLADNPNEEAIEFMGDIDFDTINEYSELIMNSKVKYVDISLSRIRLNPDAYLTQSVDNYIRHLCEDCEAKLSPLLKIYINADYSNSFIINQEKITSVDNKILIHIPDTEKITIDNGIEIIGKCAFASYQLRNIKLPSSLIEIGDYGFAVTENLTNIDLPNSIERLGESTFYFTGVETLIIPNKVEILPYQCCHHFYDTILPKSLKVLANFNAINSEKPVVLPEGLEYIGSWAFNNVDTIHIPSTVKHIEEDFFYDEPCGVPDKKPKLIISPNNKYFYSNKSKYLGRCYVEDIEVQKEFTTYALSFMPNESDRKKYEGILLSPLEMLQLVNQMPETNELCRSWFYYDIYQTSILNDEERDFLEYLRKANRNVWSQLHSVDTKKTFVMWGISENGEEDFIKEFDYSTPFESDYIKEHNLMDKYTKIICRQYSKKDTEYQTPLGEFEVEKDGMAINNISYTLPKTPEKFRRLLE